MKIVFRHRFERDLERLNKRRRGALDVDALDHAIDLFVDEKPLPASYKDHALESDWAGYREFHLDSDDLVIYRVKADVVEFCRIGTHAELFRQYLR